MNKEIISEPEQVNLGAGDDPSWYRKLAPADKVSYRQSKLAYAQACAAYKEAEAAARYEMEKPQRDFKDARDAYLEASAKVHDKDGLIAKAEEKRDALQSAAGDLKPGALADASKPDAGKEQIAKVQDAFDAYKVSAAAVAAQVQAIEAAKAALQKVSRPQEEPFNPKSAEPSEQAEGLARDQFHLAIAQAQIPLDAAGDAFRLKQAELEGHVTTRSIQ